MRSANDFTQRALKACVTVMRLMLGERFRSRVVEESAEVGMEGGGVMFSPPFVLENQCFIRLSSRTGDTQPDRSAPHLFGDHPLSTTVGPVVLVAVLG